PRHPVARLVGPAFGAGVMRRTRVDTDGPFIVDLAVGPVAGDDALRRLALLHPVDHGGEAVPFVRPRAAAAVVHARHHEEADMLGGRREIAADRKSTRLNSSHVKISYAVF